MSNPQGTAQGQTLPWRNLPRLTQDAAAELLGCSRSQVYALARRGILDMVRCQHTGRTYVTTASVVRVLDSARPFTPGNSPPRGRSLTLARERAAASSL